MYSIYCTFINRYYDTIKTLGPEPITDNSIQGTGQSLCTVYLNMSEARPILRGPPGKSPHVPIPSPSYQTHNTKDS